MEALEAVRSFCFMVSVVVLTILAYRYIRLRAGFTRTLRLFMGAMAMFLIALAWDTVILMQLDTPFSWRMFPFLSGLAMLVAALAEPVESVKRRYHHLSRDEEVMAMRLELDELHNRLYDTLRRENHVSTKLLLVQNELEQAKEQREAERPRDAV